MKRTALDFNIRPYCFSTFMLLFAISPVTEANDVVFYTLSAIMGVILLVILVSAGISISKDKKGFVKSALTPNIPFKFFDVLTSVVGIVVGYSMNSNSYQFWIFLLVLTIIAILIPTPKTENKQ